MLKIVPRPTACQHQHKKPDETRRQFEREIDKEVATLQVAIPFLTKDQIYCRVLDKLGVKPAKPGSKVLVWKDGSRIDYKTLTIEVPKRSPTIIKKRHDETSFGSVQHIRKKILGRSQPIKVHDHAGERRTRNDRPANTAAFEFNIVSPPSSPIEATPAFKNVRPPKELTKKVRTPKRRLFTISDDETDWFVEDDAELPLEATTISEKPKPTSSKQNKKAEATKENRTPKRKLFTVSDEETDWCVEKDAELPSETTTISKQTRKALTSTGAFTPKTQNRYPVQAGRKSSITGKESAEQNYPRDTPKKNENLSKGIEVQTNGATNQNCPSYGRVAVPATVLLQQRHIQATAVSNEIDEAAISTDAGALPCSPADEASMGTPPVSESNPQNSASTVPSLESTPGDVSRYNSSISPMDSGPSRPDSDYHISVQSSGGSRLSDALGRHFRQVSTEKISPLAIGHDGKSTIFVDKQRHQRIPASRERSLSVASSSVAGRSSLPGDSELDNRFQTLHGKSAGDEVIPETNASESTQRSTQAEEASPGNRSVAILITPESGSSTSPASVSSKTGRTSGQDLRRRVFHLPVLAEAARNCSSGAAANSGDSELDNSFQLLRRKPAGDEVIPETDASQSTRRSTQAEEASPRNRSVATLITPDSGPSATPSSMSSKTGRLSRQAARRRMLRLPVLSESGRTSAPVASANSGDSELDDSFQMLYGKPAGDEVIPETDASQSTRRSAQEEEPENASTNTSPVLSSSRFNVLSERSPGQPYYLKKSTKRKLNKGTSGLHLPKMARTARLSISVGSTISTTKNTLIPSQEINKISTSELSINRDTSTASQKPANIVYDRLLTQTTNEECFGNGKKADQHPDQTFEICKSSDSTGTAMNIHRQTVHISELHPETSTHQSVSLSRDLFASSSSSRASSYFSTLLFNLQQGDARSGSRCDSSKEELRYSPHAEALEKNLPTPNRHPSAKGSAGETAVISRVANLKLVEYESSDKDTSVGTPFSKKASPVSFRDLYRSSSADRTSERRSEKSSVSMKSESSAFSLPSLSKRLQSACSSISVGSSKYVASPSSDNSVQGPFATSSTDKNDVQATSSMGSQTQRKYSVTSSDNSAQCPFETSSTDKNDVQATSSMGSQTQRKHLVTSSDGTPTSHHRSPCLDKRKGRSLVAQLPRKQQLSVRRVLFSRDPLATLASVEEETPEEKIGGSYSAKKYDSSDNARIDVHQAKVMSLLQDRSNRMAEQNTSSSIQEEYPSPRGISRSSQNSMDITISPLLLRKGADRVDGLPFSSGDAVRPLAASWLRDKREAALINLTTGEDDSNATKSYARKELVTFEGVDEVQKQRRHAPSTDEEETRQSASHNLPSPDPQAAADTMISDHSSDDNRMEEDEVLRGIEQLENIFESSLESRTKSIRSVSSVTRFLSSQ